MKENDNIEEPAKLFITSENFGERNELTIKIGINSLEQPLLDNIALTFKAFPGNFLVTPEYSTENLENGYIELSQDLMNKKE